MSYILCVFSQLNKSTQDHSMRIHLIAIGGSAMHNLALALQSIGHQVSGSDDEIYDPALSRLKKAGLLPEPMGWSVDRITSDIDAVILGMHARKDNPELAKALDLGLKVYSYPEFIFEQARDKKRIVIAGSHGKTSTTSMIMHVLKKADRDFDYLVGAQLEGFDMMVRLSDAPIMIIEGDEYLSSCIDPRPKFLHYKPDIAVLTGISWDHINVFPEFSNYLDQFRGFLDHLNQDSQLFYYQNDQNIIDLINEQERGIRKQAYNVLDGTDLQHFSHVLHNGDKVNLPFFGKHNMENMHAAYLVCKSLGITLDEFLQHIQSFTGASKRLQPFIIQENAAVFLDFAHAPSKVRASVQAVRMQFSELKIRAIFELHTFSSLNKQFLQEYHSSLQDADEAFIFFDAHTIEMKRMEPLDKGLVSKSFDHPNLSVYDNKDDLAEALESAEFQGYCTVFMSSGNFRGIDFKGIAEEKLSTPAS